MPIIGAWWFNFTGHCFEIDYQMSLNGFCPVAEEHYQQKLTGISLRVNIKAINLALHYVIIHYYQRCAQLPRFSELLL